MSILYKLIDLADKHKQVVYKYVCSCDIFGYLLHVKAMLLKSHKISV